MQHNSLLPKQMAFQNRMKLFKMFMYILKFVSQANESDFEKIDLLQISHVNGNTKISSVETLVAKELALVILRLSC